MTRVNSAADITILKSHFGRWIIVLTAAKEWAWSGSRFTQHRDGVGREAHISNFDTEQEARDYAVEHVIAKPEKEGSE